MSRRRAKIGKEENSIVITSEQNDLQSIGNFKDIQLQFHKDNMAPTQSKVIPFERYPK